MATTIRVVPHSATARPSPRGSTYLLPSHVPTPSAATAAAVPTTGTTDKNGRPDIVAVLGAFALVVVGWIVAVNAIHDPHFASTTASTTSTPQGLTIFAAFFVAAQAIERLLEPVTRFFGITQGDDFAGKLADAQKAVGDALSATEAKDTSAAAKQKDAAKALNDAASAKADADKVSGNRTVLYWAIATVVATLASSSLKLYFLHAVGLETGPRAMEVLATGLIIGAGTKPLHDFVQLLEDKRSASTTAGSSVAA